MTDRQLLCYIKLVKAQEQYIKFLGKYISDISSYLHVHNMDADAKTVRKGELYREQIKCYTELVDDANLDSENFQQIKNLINKENNDK